MFGSNNNGASAIVMPHHKFERSIIFIPKWLEKRVRAFSKTEKTLKNIDGLFSILIPADVSFYIKQVQEIAQHPSVAPYFQTFNPFDYQDAASWGANISAQKAARICSDIQAILTRAAGAVDPTIYGTNESYVENNASGLVSGAFAKSLGPDVPEQGMSREELASVLGVNSNDPNIDFTTIRVIIEELDADTLIMRLDTFDPDQTKLTQVLAQTEANIRKITQYYEFNKVLASPVGKMYSRLVLLSPNS